MEAFTLVGVDGNAFSVMGYTTRAMKKAGFTDQVAQYQKEATSGDYENLICVSVQWIDKCNEALGLEDDEDWSEGY